MVAFVFLSELFCLLDAVYHTIVCRRFDTPLNLWFCGNSSSNSSSLRSPSPEGALQRVEGQRVLSLAATFAGLMSNVAFFWCMWKLEGRSVYCATMDKAYKAAKRSNWVTLNCSMFTFGILLLIELFWFNLLFKEKFTLADRVGASLLLIPQWVTLTNSWLFALVTIGMKNCVSRCHAEIRNAVHCSPDDIIRIRKRLCQQLSSTSEALKIWFVVHWFLLAIVAFIFVAEMVSIFKHGSDLFFFYQFVLWTLIYLDIFVYPTYCASSVTVRCNKMLKDLNMTKTTSVKQGTHCAIDLSRLFFFSMHSSPTVASTSVTPHLVLALRGFQLKSQFAVWLLNCSDRMQRQRVEEGSSLQICPTFKSSFIY